jgi:hypothetical protein
MNEMFLNGHKYLPGPWLLAAFKKPRYFYPEYTLDSIVGSSS